MKPGMPSQCPPVGRSTWRRTVVHVVVVLVWLQAQACVQLQSCTAAGQSAHTATTVNPCRQPGMRPTSINHAHAHQTLIAVPVAVHCQPWFPNSKHAPIGLAALAAAGAAGPDGNMWPPAAATTAVAATAAMRPSFTYNRAHVQTLHVTATASRHGDKRRRAGRQGKQARGLHSTQVRQATRRAQWRKPGFPRGFSSGFSCPLPPTPQPDKAAPNTVH